MTIHTVEPYLSPLAYWCLVGNGWEWGNGMIITSDYGSFPHSLLSTSQLVSNHSTSPSFFGSYDFWRQSIKHVSSYLQRTACCWKWYVGSITPSHLSSGFAEQDAKYHSHSMPPFSSAALACSKTWNLTPCDLAQASFGCEGKEYS